ncbi:MAG: ABC transporter ATP-binding protein [Kiritimatiellae bacterium]|nr:ABC transporter ATP-binding protein [Kiritimatiellia bacterium]MDW8459096.1 ABC transporter ATP-binding protein [Verrucomicrobiota bacterium]
MVFPPIPAENAKPVPLPAGGLGGQTDIVLSVRDLSIQFGSAERPVRAVDSVSFDIAAGEVVALVGESGCGKSATALAVARLLPEPPARYTGGSIILMGVDVLKADAAKLRAMRGGSVAYVFQEPAAALNPVWSIGFQIDEVLRAHRPEVDRAAERERLFRAVGLDDVKRVSRAYPHELSGGMQQRAMIAMALAGGPRLLIADEPTTALDVTVQKQVLDVLIRLARETNLAMLFITHNLALASKISRRIIVMYAGQIVEEGTAEHVLSSPRHPYTRALLRALPRLRGSLERLEGIPGVVPAADAYPGGCRFHPRCPFARKLCSERVPDMEEGVRCHFWREIPK